MMTKSKYVAFGVRDLELPGDGPLVDKLEVVCV